MSTPELKPETPLTDAAKNELRLACLHDELSWAEAFDRACDTARKLESALNAAREAIENAPHDGPCLAGNNWFKKPGFESPCTCWKAEALAQIDKALSPQQSKTT